MRIELEASSETLTALLGAFQQFAKRHRVPARVRQEMHLALDEVVSNILRHGCQDGKRHWIAVELTIDSGALLAEVVDDARPFNPLRARDPAAGVPLEERPIGGLGIHLVKRLMDKVEYSRERGRNRLILRRRLRARTRRA